jgi:hypothetical protein
MSKFILKPVMTLSFLLICQIFIQIVSAPPVLAETFPAVRQAPKSGRLQKNKRRRRKPKKRAGRATLRRLRQMPKRKFRKKSRALWRTPWRS